MPSKLNSAPAPAGAVRVLSPSAMHSSLEPIAEAHRKQQGGEVRLTFETAPVLAKRSLLEAEAIIYNRASSGLYVARMLDRLGIAREVKEKSALYHDAVGAFTRLASGKGREIGFGGITEIRRWHDRGLRLVAPLPADIQNYTAYMAALATDPPNPGGARTLLRFLGSPAAKAIFAANGVD